MDYQEYIVTLKNKDDLAKFYADMELLGGDGSTPDRPVGCACKRPTSRNTHYHLTKEEADLIRKDDRVLDIDLLPSIKGIFPSEHYEQTESDWDKSPTITSAHKNWGLLRCVEGVQRADWGSDNIANQSGSIQVNSSGKNVDVVINDGSHIDPTHPEFAVNADGTGGSRVIQYNWFQHNPEVLGTDAGNYSYTEESNHSAHVAGTVAGNTQGWAREANIYTISFSTESVFDFIRAFHNNKPINPETGRKNPTIVNNSWGMNYSYDGLAGYGISDINWRGSSTPNPTEQNMLDYGYKTTSYLNGLPARSTALDTDVEEAILAGLIVIGSAGNSGMKMDVSGGVDFDNFWNIDGIGSDYYHRGSSPGAAEGMICVGSIDSARVEPKSTFSNCGPRIDIFAPGGNITSSVNWAEYSLSAEDPRDSNYTISKISGTSMASPQVSGIVACLLEQYPNHSQGKVLEYLNYYSKSNQLHFLNEGGYQDSYDMQGSPDKYSYIHKERPDNGLTFPKINKDIRPSEGVVYPRYLRSVTKVEELSILATGGSVETIGDYRIHTFTTDDTFEVVSGYGFVSCLVIGGGGGGGEDLNPSASGAASGYWGGGGAGEIKQANFYVMGGENHPISIGLGGSPNNNGAISFALSATSLGGGAGGAGRGSDGSSGGSGGGGATAGGLGGVTSNGFGFYGGLSDLDAEEVMTSAGGGGGFKSYGRSINSTTILPWNSGWGGAGFESDFSGTDQSYGAGGAGAGFLFGSRKDGVGGASDGIVWDEGALDHEEMRIVDKDGTPSTGSGGGGGRKNLSAGSGGSGIVIVRYKI